MSRGLPLNVNLQYFNVDGGRAGERTLRTLARHARRALLRHLATVIARRRGEMSRMLRQVRLHLADEHIVVRVVWMNSADELYPHLKGQGQVVEAALFQFRWRA